MSDERKTQEPVYKYHQREWFEWNGVPLSSYGNNMEKLDEVEEFKFGEDDVLIWTYPKAGTHFCADVVIDAMMTIGKMPEKRMYPLELMKPDYKLRDSTPKTVFTHLPWRLLPKQARDGKVKMICCMRNPKDVFCSFFSFHKKVGAMEPGTTMDQYLEDYVTGKLQYGDYFDWLKDWYPHKDDPSVLNLYFEDMKTDLESAILKIVKHIGVALTGEQIEKIVSDNTFSNRTKASTGFLEQVILRKGEAGGWKKELTEAQINKLDDWISKSMEGFEDVDLKL